MQQQKTRLRYTNCPQGVVVGQYIHGDHVAYVRTYMVIYFNYIPDIAICTIIF